MELEINQIQKLEFVAEEITRLVVYVYSHIYNFAWSLPAKCTGDSSLFTA